MGSVLEAGRQAGRQASEDQDELLGVWRGPRRLLLQERLQSCLCSFWEPEVWSTAVAL